MTVYEHNEFLEEYLDCPECGNEDIDAMTTFTRVTNETHDVRYNLRVECDECDSTYLPNLFKTKSSTRVVRPK